MLNIPNRANRQLGAQRGASLVEVMVAVVVLSIGLLGLGLLQAKSLLLNTDAYLRTQATLIANELIEDMRANPTANYIIASKPAAVCSSCTTEQKMADAAVIRWYNAQESQLPGNTSDIELNGSGLHVLTMKWKERSLDVTQTWVLSL